MALSDFFTAIQVDFIARSVVLSEPILVGNVKPNFNGVFPRIACRATNDTYTSPIVVGGVQPAHKTRNAGFDAHIWGETYDLTEALLNEFLVSLENVSPRHSLSGGAWNNAVGHLSNGFEYVLSCSVELPAAQQSAYQTIAVSTFIETDTMQSFVTSTAFTHTMNGSTVI